jgi:phosphoenolpyruvate carboxykinase (ATP)
MLGEKLDAHDATVFLVNTGWTGGPFGEGQRMPIQATRTMLRAALSGELEDATFRTDDHFGFEVPVEVAGVEPKLLDPRLTWRDPEQYDVKARELAEMFAENFSRRFGDVDAAIRAAGPRV